MEEERLRQKISDLKKDIQYIIEKKKSGAEKDVKMALLKDLTKKLKDLKKKKVEINKAQSAVNSLDYHAANRGKGKEEGVQKFRLAREAREKAKNEYFDYLKLEEKYNEMDPKEVPGPLFLHEAVLNAYGYCPYIEINFETEDVTATVRKQRQEWLASKEDKGQIYYSLYDDLYNKKALLKVEAAKEEQVKKMEETIKSVLNDVQWELYTSSMEIIKEWVSCNVRTKRIKDKFKGLTHNMSVLYAETLLPIHEFLSLEYLPSHPNGIMVNEVKMTRDKLRTTDLYMSEKFREDINCLKELKESESHKRKWIINTMKNVKHELYLCLTKSSESQFRQRPKFVPQIGKYFKRWTALSVEEKEERFYSFAKHYVTRYMVSELLIEQSQEEEYTKKLNDLLCNAHKNKELIYRDFAWVTKHGMIEKVKVLKYNKETECFFLDSHHKAAKVAKQQSKKRASNKTIFTKENEKIINEQILYWVVKRVQSGVGTEESGGSEQTKNSGELTKETCLEKVKEQLNLKRINNNDKAKLYEKYEEMYTVVTNSSKISVMGSSSGLTV